MKRNFLIAGIILLLTVPAIRSVAQDVRTEAPPARAVPKWVSEKGYWKLENNIKTPENFIIYFYNNEGTLVYKEKVEGVKLNIKKKKTLMRLKSVLDQSVTAWERDHMMKENEMLVAAALKGNLVIR